MKVFRSVFVLMLVFCGLLSIGCSTPVSSEAEQIEVPDDKAVIFFYRTGRGGGAIKFHVHKMDGSPVGYLGANGDHFTIEVEPGTHQFWSRAASRNDVILNVEAGKVYYVKGTVKMRAAVGRPVLEQVTFDDLP